MQDSPVTRREIGETLLSLLSRCACLEVSRDQEGDEQPCDNTNDAPFSLECSSTAFGCLLSLVEQLVGHNFVSELEDRFESLVRPHSHDKESNLEDSTSKSLHLEESIHLESKANDGVPNTYLTAEKVGSNSKEECSTLAIIHASFNPLISTLQILRCNMENLLRMYKGKKGDCQLDQSSSEQVPLHATQSTALPSFGEVKPRFLERVLDCESDGEVSSESENSRTCRQNFGSDELNDIRGGQNESKVENSSRVGEVNESKNERGNQYAGERQHLQESMGASEPGVDHSDRDVTPPPGGDDLSVNGSILDESTNDIVDVSVTTEMLQNAFVQTKEQASPVRVGVADVLDGSIDSIESLQSLSEDVDVDVDKRGRATAISLRESSNPSPQHVDMPTNETKFSADSPQGSMALPQDSSSDNDEDEDEGIGSSKFGQNVSEMVQDLGDVELQRAILSSMEMPSDTDEGSIILKRYRNCVHEAHLYVTSSICNP